MIFAGLDEGESVTGPLRRATAHARRMLFPVAVIAPCARWRAARHSARRDLRCRQRRRTAPAHQSGLPAAGVVREYRAKGFSGRGLAFSAGSLVNDSGGGSLPRLRRSAARWRSRREAPGFCSQERRRRRPPQPDRRGGTGGRLAASVRQYRQPCAAGDARRRAARGNGRAGHRVDCRRPQRSRMGSSDPGRDLAGVQAKFFRTFACLPPDLPAEAIVAELRLLKSGALLRRLARCRRRSMFDAVARSWPRRGRLLLGGTRESGRSISIRWSSIRKGQGAIALDALILAA